MSGTFQFTPSFGAGVLAPGLLGRIDLSKYQVGLKTGKNIFIEAHGGFVNRAGTKFVDEVQNHDFRHVLIPFERDEDTTYVTVWGENTLRFISNGARIAGAGITTPYTSQQARNLQYVQSIDVMYLAHSLNPPKKLNHFGPTSWTITDYGTSPATPTPGAPTITSATAGSTTYRYKVSAVIGGIEGLASPTGVITTARSLDEADQYNDISWSAVTGADEYRVYRLRGGVFGYIGFTTGTSLRDDNIDPDTATTIRQETTLFNGVGNYPSVVTIAQQRLVWAASNRKPETIWASLVGDYENFSRGQVLVASDRIIMDVSGEKLNRVKALVGMQELMAFTGSGEYGIGTGDGVLNAVEPRQQRYGGNGTTGVRPLIVGDSILFVDRSGRMVRDLRYSFESDGYAGNDLTVFVPHFFLGRQIVDWCYSHSPYGIIWVVLSDGSVCSLTYKREQEVWAWTEHDFGGFVESICAVRESSYDAVYLIVRRNINGTQKRYVERMDNRLIEGNDPMDVCFLDCAVTQVNGPGSGTNTVSGLGHLNGMTITVIADGDVYENIPVSGGNAILPVGFTIAHAGLPYVSEGETLPIAVELKGTGNSRGLPTKATEVMVQMEKTRGIEVRTTDATSGTQMVQTIADLSDEIPLFTGLWRFDLPPDWNSSGTIRIIQKWPLPMNVLAVSPRWSIGRG